MAIIYEFLTVTLLTITIEWLVVFFVTKTKLIDKFLPKQNPKNSYVQFKSSGIDMHFEGNALDAVNEIKKFFMPDTTLEDRINNRIEISINKNIDKITDVMLDNKKVKEQIQKQIFDIVKNKLSDNIDNKKVKK